MSKRILAYLFAYCCTLPTYAQPRSALRVMEYNVENLFDTLHATGHQDIEFTPQGDHQWNSARYWAKLSRLSKVIAAVGGATPVDLVALVEVENDSVVNDLTKRTKLWSMGYEYVMTHSADARGINVALLYLPHRFRLLSKDTIRVMPPSAKQHVTRDVMHVVGELITGDTLDVFVCHFPSRRGGEKAQRYRSLVAQRTHKAADSIINRRQHPYVLITGDFNGYYPEPFLRDTLGVKLCSQTDTTLLISSSDLYLLTHRLQGQSDVRGTYKFQGTWNQLDHFIVNGAFWLRSSPLLIREVDGHFCRLIDFPFLLQADKSGQGGVHPFRTYLGPYYQGGYSDHLPIVLDIIQK